MIPQKVEKDVEEEHMDVCQKSGEDKKLPLAEDGITVCGCYSWSRVPPDYDHQDHAEEVAETL